MRSLKITLFPARISLSLGYLLILKYVENNITFVLPVTWVNLYEHMAIQNGTYLSASSF